MIQPLKKAGPLGRARTSVVLQKRPMGDPRIRRNANLLATNRRTARGVSLLNTGVNDTPPPVIDEQVRRIEASVNSIILALQERGLMETGP